MYVTRILNDDDRSQLEAFLRRHADTSMIIRGNLFDDGVVDRGQRFQGPYAGAFDGAGELRTVAVHYQRGNVCVAGEDGAALEGAVRETVAVSGRPVMGLIGPRVLVRAARSLLGLDSRPAQMDSDEGLYALDLADLQTPALLSDPEIAFREPRPEDREVMLRWYLDYELESLGGTESPELLERVAVRVDDALARGERCLLTCRGVACATTGFNARLPEQVQVGGVYTPPEARSRGYARTVVAGSLLDARERGLKRAILFTGEDNPAAIKAYRALGFERIGDFNITLFR